MLTPEQDHPLAQRIALLDQAEHEWMVANIERVRRDLDFLRTCGAEEEVMLVAELLNGSILNPASDVQVIVPVPEKMPNLTQDSEPDMYVIWTTPGRERSSFLMLTSRRRDQIPRIEIDSENVELPSQNRKLFRQVLTRSVLAPGSMDNATRQGFQEGIDRGETRVIYPRQ